MNTGAKETAATLILGYAAPTEPEWHNRMVWLFAWFVATIPLLHLMARVPTAVQVLLQWQVPLLYRQLPGELFRIGLLFSIEPVAALLLAFAMMRAAIRRKISPFTIMAVAVCLSVITLEVLLEPSFYWFEFQYAHRYLSNALFLPARIAPIVFPMLLVLLLNPASQESSRYRSARLHLLTFLTGVAGASEMLVMACATPGMWEGPVRDFWSFLDGNIEGTLVALGQLILDLAIVVLTTLLGLCFLTRRVNATFLRAATSLLLVGWLFLITAAIPTHLHLFRSFFPGDVQLSPYLVFGFLHQRAITYESTSSMYRLLYAAEFMGSAAIPLILILSLRIALNRPELPWNQRPPAPDGSRPAR